MKKEHADTESLVSEIFNAASDKKAIEIVVLRVAELCSIADYFIFCSGQNIRHTKTIAEAVEARLRKNGTRALHLEGVESGRWILLDYGDIIVHVFLPDVRDFYDLERLWGDAEAIPEAELSRA